MDPITKEMVDKPMKPFMINQLQLLIERGDLILSPYDEVLFKQMIDYKLEKKTDRGIPKFSSKNEHFIDALGLANLALVLEFKDLMGVIKEAKSSNKIEVVRKSFGTARVDADLAIRETAFMDQRIKDFYKNTDFSERGSDRQKWVKVDETYRSTRRYSGSYSNKWGSRGVKGMNSFSR